MRINKNMKYRMSAIGSEELLTGYGQIFVEEG